MSQPIDRHDWFAEYGDLLAIELRPESRFTPWATVHEYKKAFRSMAYNKEDNDCGVRALAVACAAPYDKAHWALQKAGRPAGHSCHVFQMIHAATMLRCHMVRTTCTAKTLRTVERELVKTHGGFIVTTCSHAAGVWNGELIDHARGTLSRVTEIYRIEQMRSKAP